MSATTTSPLSSNAGITIDLSSTPRVAFSRLVHVELRKTWNTRAGLWLLLGIGGLSSLICAVMLIVSATGDHHIGYGSFVSGASFGTSVLLPVMAILAVTSEWSQRTTLTTFALEPHRPRVVWAKLVATLILTLIAIAFVLAAAAVANALNSVLADSAPWEYGADQVIGFGLTQALAMLGGFAFATLLLNSPAAIVAFFATTFILPTLFNVVSSLSEQAANAVAWIDFTGAQAQLRDLSLTGEGWSHLIVSGVIWLAIPFVFGLRRVLRAEVK